MTRVCACWPSVNHDKSKKMVDVWRERGYLTSVLMENDKVAETGCDYPIFNPKWVSFPDAANKLCHNNDADIVVLVGDDIFPDKKHTAQEVAKVYLKYFPNLQGVMQPIGDRFASIMTCCISPWIGRTFIKTVYDGKGPYWPEYYHYYSDHELQIIAPMHGGFIQITHISQYHDHWQRHNLPRPEYLQKALKEWNSDQTTFLRRKVRNFPWK